MTFKDHDKKPSRSSHDAPDDLRTTEAKAKFLAGAIEDILPINKLEIRWDDAQQPFVQKHGDNIAKDFNWELMNQVYVTGPFSNGKYHIIDGQHRVYAAGKIGGEKECVICRVYPPMDKAHAAWLFHELNSKRRKPQALSLFRTAVTSGHEPEATISKIVKGVGFAIGSSSSSNHNISGIKALEYVYRLGGSDHPKLLCNTLVAIRNTWSADEPSVTDSIIIRSFGLFLHSFPEAKLKRTQENVCKTYTPSRFVGAAKTGADAKLIHTTQAGCDVLVRMHNQGLRKDLLPERR